VQRLNAGPVGALDQLAILFRAGQSDGDRAAARLLGASVELLDALGQPRHAVWNPLVPERDDPVENVLAVSADENGRVAVFCTGFGHDQIASKSTIVPW